MAQPSDGLPKWWKAYFAAIASNGGFRYKAAEQVGIDKSTPAKYIEKNPHLKEQFDAAMTEALDQASESLMNEAVRRGRDGYEEPVFYLGKEVAKVKKYSDTLLMFTLNARGKGTRNTSFTLDLTKLTDEQLRRLADGEDPVTVVASGGGKG
jgi:hypothetical protein